MFNRNDYSSAFDFEQDRDLIAQMNEAGDPAQLDSLTRTARQRLRSRHHEAAARREQTQHTGRRLVLPRLLTSRH